MSTSIDAAFVYEFESLVHHLGQQEVSRLMNTVRVKVAPASAFHFERIAKSDMATKGTGAGTGGTGYTRNAFVTPINNVVHSRRAAIPSAFEWGEAIDPQDAARVLIDPQSAYVEAASMAWGRKIDDVIMAAAVGNAKIGINGAGGDATIPAGNALGAVAALTLDHLRQAKRRLDQAEVAGERYFAHSSKMLEDLLKVTEITSVDYNNVKALVNGEVDTFMGFKFIRTELVPGVSGQPTRKLGVFYTSKSIGLCLPMARFSRIGEDPSRSFMTRIYLETLLGAVRIEDEAVVTIDVANH